MAAAKPYLWSLSLKGARSTHCEKESEVRSENDSEEEETYLVSDGSALIAVPAASAGRADVGGRKSERRARSEARTTARRRRLT